MECQDSNDRNSCTGITAAAYRRAFALAAAHCHEWAWAPDYSERHPELVDPPQTWLKDAIAMHDAIAVADPVSLSSIVDLVNLRRGGVGSSDSTIPGGITAPQVNNVGDIWHTTGSGRLTWYIESDGRTTLIVSRPSPEELELGQAGPGIPVLQAIVDAAGCAVVERKSTSTPICLRHIQTMAAALSALEFHWDPELLMAPLGCDTASDPLQGYSPDEIVVGAAGQTLADVIDAPTLRG